MDPRRPVTFLAFACILILARITAGCTPMDRQIAAETANTALDGICAARPAAQRMTVAEWLALMEKAEQLQRAGATELAKAAIAGPPPASAASPPAAAPSAPAAAATASPAP